MVGDIVSKGGIRVEHPVAAGEVIMPGELIAVNGSGYAVVASDTAGLVVIGVSLKAVDNSGGKDGDVKVLVKQCCVVELALYNLDRTNIGDPVYVYDSHTVANVGSTNNGIRAGVLQWVSDDNSIGYVWTGAGL